MNSESKRWNLHQDKLYELSQDLIGSKLPIGKAKQDVRQLLGNDAIGPDSTDLWSVNLGYRPELFIIDPSDLQIDFGNNYVFRVEQIH